MKRALTFSILVVTLFIIIAFNAVAAIWHVSNVGKNANFTSLTAAHNSEKVTAGDTLYVYGTSKDYDDLVSSKNLNIIGSGYFLNENQETQADTTLSKIGNITFNPGSEGSSISGMTISQIYLYCNDITIKRNFISFYRDYQYVIHLHREGEIQNIIIAQNFISGRRGIDFTFSTNANNIIIFNNIITTYSHAIEMSENDHAIIKNNVINGGLSIYNSIFYNNIQMGGGAKLVNSDVKFNLEPPMQDYFGTINGNKTVDMSTVFVSEGSTDGRYQLAENSPAKNAGDNGIDCGVFDGTDPYILSGIPMIPTIYYINVPAIASELSGLPVHIKVKSRNWLLNIN